MSDSCVNHHFSVIMKFYVIFVSKIKLKHKTKKEEAVSSYDTMQRLFAVGIIINCLVVLHVSCMHAM